MSGSDLSWISAKLSAISAEVSAVNRRIELVSEQVVNVNQEVQKAKSDLSSLVQEFRDFVNQHMRDKEIQLAETRLIKVRQQLEKEYGHYDEVRRTATGILQAVDAGVVSEEIIKAVSEELMIATPRYWLAPCLVALAAWIHDNRPLAEKAIKEALARDERKASLFFALISRRAGRFQAVQKWLRRYFESQTPKKLDRNMVVVIDGFTNGIFGVTGISQTIERLKEWNESLKEDGEASNRMLEEWKNALLEKFIKDAGNDYTHLRQYAENWDELFAIINGVKIHQNMLTHFKDMLEKDEAISPQLVQAVDDLLNNLVTRYDDEEINLRKEDRLLSLIIEENGDRHKAESRFSSEEKYMENSMDYADWLKGVALYPEYTGASKATQKLAISLSRDWIRAAHEDLTAKFRLLSPAEIRLSIGQWTGITKDGSEEAELLQSLLKHLDQRMRQDLLKARGSWGRLIGGAFCGLLSLSSLLAGDWFWFLVFLAGAAWLLRNTYKAVMKTIEVYQNLKKHHPNILRNCLAEVVEWRREFEREDAKAEEVRKFLDDLNMEQFVFSRYQSGRKVLMG